MSVIPSRTPGRQAATPPVASPAPREALGGTRSPGRAASSRETPSQVGVIPAFRPSQDAMSAYVDLWRALHAAQEQGEEVPCLGSDSDAWTSDHRDEQQRAALACADCPALALCGRYAELAREPVGTWGGVTRGRRGRARTVPAKGRHCACGCDGVTKGGRYRVGHDARHLSQLVRSARAGAISREGAHRALAGSPGLQAKLAQRLRG